MLEKHDARRSRNGRANGATGSTPTTAQRGAATANKLAVAPHGLKLRRYFTSPGDDGFGERRVGAAHGRDHAARTARWSSSRRTSRSPRAGARPRPTSSCRSTSAARSARPSASARCASSSARVADTITAWGNARTATSPTTNRRACSAPSSSTSSSSRRWPSTRRSGSTSASSPSRSARPASSTASRTRWSRSSAWPRPRGCCSSTARAPAPTCRPIRSSRELLQRRRHGLRPGQLHARLRRLRRRHQVGRQDPPRRQDGHPQHRPPGRRRVHLVQGEGGEEGLGADRRRLRRLVRRRGVQVGLLPELEQLGARHRRLHGGGAEGPRVVDPRRRATGGRSRRSRRASCGATSPRPPGSAAIPGLQFDTTINAWHTSPGTARINASNPCSRVHVPRRLGVQPGVAQPAQVRQTPRPASSTSSRSGARSRSTILGAGDHRRQRQVPDRADPRTTRTASGRSASATPTWARC